LPAAAAGHSAPTTRRGRSPLAIAVAAFLLGGTVGGGGVALGFALDDGQDSAGSVVTVSAPSLDGTTTGPAASSATTSPPATGSSGSATDSVEPAALVARSLGPSVVQVETNRGQGSGVVYADGLLLTNHHVIEGATQVQVRTSDGRVVEVEVLGSDARNDIAVLSAPGSNLPVAAIGSSADLEPGQLTVAIGSPFDLQQTVTAGIVSSTNRPVPNSAGSLTAMIQTDAPINPGNSGGALANRDGELVGINASIRTDGTSNSNVGIGFAVPIDTALAVADRIVNDQSLEPGLLGVRGENRDDGIGVPIVEVTAGSAADLAGLQPGDRVLTIEGAPVTNIEELVGLVQSRFAGDSVALDVVRGSSTLTVEAVLT
jgi:putative serine protease PepD